MRVPVKWIKDFVDIDVPIKELGDRLTMTGTKTEGIIDIGKNIDNVVVGKVEEILPHPNADKLVITKINIGSSENIQIVTGAKNLSAGDIVPVALNNSTLPSDKEPYYVKIKKGKLRGVESNGMLCSCEELGVDERFVGEESKNGIWILDKNLTLGEDIKTALDLQDYILEFEITSNRPDCLSMIGVAKEVAATLNVPIRLPENKYSEVEHNPNIQVEVADKALCPRYMLREITDVKIEQSPYFMQRRLIEAGVRPINNIVDITNFVMLEYGQPMHAFDENYFGTKKVVVKTAKDGEKYTTLDNQERTLDKDVLMITDGENNLGIAGVMGGLNSEITKNTKNVILESAIFDNESIRLTSKRLGLRTESSSRFEKGIDLNRAELAMDRACHLIEKYGWGKVSNWKADTLKEDIKKTTLEITQEEIDTAVGNKLSKETIIDIFKRLEFEIETQDNKYIITAPYFRIDIGIKADLMEEIIRLYGYDKIEPVNMISETTYATQSLEKIFTENSKDAFCVSGFTEVVNYSFIGEKDLNAIGFDTKEAVYLLNPLGEDTAIMRTTLIPTMLNTVSRNYNRKNDFFAGFEIGHIFHKTNDVNNPEEKKEIIGALYGAGETFFTMKERLITYFDEMRIKDISFVPQNYKNVFHPNRCASIMSNGETIGYIGQVNPIILENYDVSVEVYMFILDFAKTMSGVDGEILYTPISKFPSVKRDISFIVDKNTTIAQIESVIKEIKSDLISSIELFDIYEGANIDTSKKSVTYSIIYQLMDRTLTEDEVNEVQEKIAQNIFTKLDAKLRD